MASRIYPDEALPYHNNIRNINLDFIRYYTKDELIAPIIAKGNIFENGIAEE